LPGAGSIPLIAIVDRTIARVGNYFETWRHCDNGIIGHILVHHCIRTHFDIVPDIDLSEHLGARGKIAVIADSRVSPFLLRPDPPTFTSCEMFAFDLSNPITLDENVGSQSVLPWLFFRTYITATILSRFGSVLRVCTDVHR